MSVVIPTFRRWHLLGSALQSVRAQTYPRLELLVVDDGSPEGTPEWVAQQHPEAKLLRFPKNRGPAAARNLGIRHARGELIAFLDSDDRWLPQYLETQLQSLRTHPEAVLSFCNYKLVLQDGSESEIELDPQPLYTQPLEHLLMDNAIHTMSIVVARHEAVLQAGLFDETLRSPEDVHLYWRLAHLGDMVHTAHSLVVKRHGGDNLAQDCRRGQVEMMKAIDLFFADPRHQGLRWIEGAARCNWTLRLARVALQVNRDYWFALRLFGRAFSYSPAQFVRMWRRKLRERRSSSLESLGSARREPHGVLPYQSS